jgi:hypothetical protein
MITLELGQDIYEWSDPSTVLIEDYYKIVTNQILYLKEVISDSDLRGVVLIGDLNIIVDSVIYTKSQGAFGETTHFQGSTLVVFGLEISMIESSIRKVVLDTEKVNALNQEADQILNKVKTNLACETTNIHFDDDPETKYIIFGRKNFFLIGSKSNFVLIHKKQVSIRKGNNNLVQIDKNKGITISNKEKVLRIGGTNYDSAFSCLGELGVNIASKVLESLVWE